MGKRTCSVDNCVRTHYARGYCNRHYIRARKHGSPHVGVDVYADPVERLNAYTRPDGECIAWTGYLDEGGYARLTVDGAKVYAHRWVWERTNGPVPRDIDVDHICHNRACVKIEHLRLASKQQNSSNRSGSLNALGLRNVYKLPSGSYRVVVGSPPHRLTKTCSTIEEATETASLYRRKLFGEFAGLG